MPSCEKFVSRVVSHNGESIAVAGICACDAVKAYYTIDGPTYRCKDHIDKQWEFAEISFEDATLKGIEFHRAYNPKNSP